MFLPKLVEVSGQGTAWGGERREGACRDTVRLRLGFCLGSVAVDARHATIPLSVVWLEVERRGDMHDSGLVKVGDCCSCMDGRTWAGP
jgi:hypothetical protein